MKDKIIDFDELTDSREMLEAKPPLVMSLFIYLVLSMFIAAFLWMWFGKIEIVVRAVGVVRPVQNISIVNNITSGEIKELFYSSGAYVKKGDLLFSIDTGPLNIEKTGLDRALFEVEQELSGYQKLQLSIITGVERISKADIWFYNKYLQYSIKKEQLTLDLIKAENLYRKESELPPDMIAGNKLQESKSELVFAELLLKAFESESQLSIEETIINLKKDKNELNDQLEKIKINLENCFIHSPISGTIQKIESYNIGDYLSAGVQILKIVPGEGTDLKAELMIQNKDIANIKEGSVIRYEFASLPQREYGFLTGTVNKIPGDISLTTEGTDGIFVVEGGLDKLILVNKNGQITKIRIGMFFEARIIIREQRILNYLLEKLDFLS